MTEKQVYLLEHGQYCNSGIAVGAFTTKKLLREYVKREYPDMRCIQRGLYWEDPETRKWMRGEALDLNPEGYN